MNPFQYLTSLTHHAYFIHAFKDSIQKLKDFLKEKFGIEHLQNPDFYYEKFTTLGIDESRKIKEMHVSKSFKEGKKRVFIIEAENITHEAQNALLKVFEEPHADSHFFLVMPSVDILLPTLKSRFFVFDKSPDQKIESVASFIKMSKKEKVDFVDAMAKKITDGDMTKGDAMDFLSNIENFLYKDGLEKNRDSLKVVLKAKGYMSSRSPSIKQLLEYVSLSL